MVASANLAYSSDPLKAKRCSEIVLEHAASGDWKALVGEQALDEGAACGSGCLATILATHMIPQCAWNLLGRGDSSTGTAAETLAGTDHEAGDDQIVHYAAAAWYPKRS